MLHCPRCQSPNIVSNKLHPEHIERVMQVAQATQSIGIRRVSILAGLGAVAIRAVNELRADYHCVDCHHRFDDSDCGVTTVA
jgi:hypothetical protein